MTGPKVPPEPVPVDIVVGENVMFKCETMCRFVGGPRHGQTGISAGTAQFVADRVLIDPDPEPVTIDGVPYQVAGVFDGVTYYTVAGYKIGTVGAFATMPDVVPAEDVDYTRAFKHRKIHGALIRMVDQYRGDGQSWVLWSTFRQWEEPVDGGSKMLASVGVIHPERVDVPADRDVTLPWEE